ncbi:hypothetical protein ACFFJ5_17860 [Kaistia hirudinis]
MSDGLPRFTASDPWPERDAFPLPGSVARRSHLDHETARRPLPSVIFDFRIICLWKPRNEAVGWTGIDPKNKIRAANAAFVIARPRQGDDV